MPSKDKGPFSFYCVSVGRKTGVFTKWNNASSSVTRYPGSVYKGCHTLDEAAEMLDVPPDTPMIHHEGAAYTLKEFKILQQTNETSQTNSGDKGINDEDILKINDSINSNNFDDSFPKEQVSNTNITSKASPCAVSNKNTPSKASPNAILSKKHDMSQNCNNDMPEMYEVFCEKHSKIEAIQSECMQKLDKYMTEIIILNNIIQEKDQMILNLKLVT